SSRCASRDDRSGLVATGCALRYACRRLTKAASQAYSRRRHGLAQSSGRHFARVPAASPAMAMIRFGIDLGGTKTEIIALDDAGKGLLRRRIATPKDDYRATLDSVAELVRGAETELGSAGSVGIGTPGSLSRATGLLRGSNSVCLNGKPIKSDLEARLKREV